MGALSWTTEPDGERVLVTLSGELKEHSQLGELEARLAGRKVTLDLSGIRRVNSGGVREWLDFISGVATRGEDVVLQRCSVPIVHQLNLVASFHGGAKIESVLAPFYCGDCNTEQLRLLQLGTDIPSQLGPPERCAGCGALMEFDELLETYANLPT